MCRKEITYFNGFIKMGWFTILKPNLIVHLFIISVVVLTALEDDCSLHPCSTGDTECEGMQCCRNDGSCFYPNELECSMSVMLGSSSHEIDIVCEDCNDEEPDDCSQTQDSSRTEIVSKLLDCLSEDGTPIMRTIQPCKHVHDVLNYTCKIERGQGRINQFLEECGNSTSEQSMLERFYEIVKGFQNPCDNNQGVIRNEVKMIINNAGSEIDWDRIENISVLCLLEEDVCETNTNVSDRIGRLLSDKTDDMKCQEYNRIAESCCQWGQRCINLLVSLVPCVNMTTTSRERLFCEDPERNPSPTSDGCSEEDFSSCHLGKTTERNAIREHIRKNCASCDNVPTEWRIHVSKCINSKLVLTEKDVETFVEATEDITAKEMMNAPFVGMLDSFPGSVKNLTKYDMVVNVLPRERMSDLTIDDVDEVQMDIFPRLPLPKKQQLLDQTLPLFTSNLERTEVIQSHFYSKQCAFLPSINVSTLEEADRVSLTLAMDMCMCSDTDMTGLQAKVAVLCKIMGYLLENFEMFKTNSRVICSTCFEYLLQMHPDWEEQVLADADLKSSACDKIGGSFVLPAQTIEKWAKRCTETSKASGCESKRPSFMPYMASLPSVEDLAGCKEQICIRLCNLPTPYMNMIQEALQGDSTENLGCLAHLEEVGSHTGGPEPVDGAAIRGSCQLKSRILKKSRSSTSSKRKKRTTSLCIGSCEDVIIDISNGIPPQDVISPYEIPTCANERFFDCFKNNKLGQYQWDVEQAKAILKMIRETGNIEGSFENWSGTDIWILGYIGIAFTPEELNTIKGVTMQVYEIFGTAYGWSPQQLMVLAQRYLKDYNLEPSELTTIHLARLNHLVCGLTADQVKDIHPHNIMLVTSILGRMKRCEIEVLLEIAVHLVLYHGPVKDWKDENFSEFGILLAGLRGEDLKRVGPRLSDYVTVPFVSHIPPAEFRKLSPEQTKLFSYEVCLALSERGLCAWLSERHKGGYLSATCVSGASQLPVWNGLHLLLAATGLCFSVTRFTLH